jgi:voltage-gated potassium channel
MLENLEPRIKIVLASLAGILITGTMGYHLIEGWSLFDALYMTTITLATIGYGEVHPLSTGGRIFTICLSLAGLGVVAYSFSTITAFVVEGRLTHALRRRKMESRIAKLENHYIVCGVGYTGESIIDELLKTNRPFVAIDRDEKHCAEMRERGIMVVNGDALQDDTLVKAGIERAKGICAALDSDPDNVFLTLSARGLNPRLRIVSEVHDDDVRERILRSGADAVVSSQSIGGLRMASEMVRPAAVGFLDSMIRDPQSTHRFEEVVVRKDSSLVGKTIAGFCKSRPNGPLVLAIKDPRTARYSMNPDPKTVLAAEDTVVVVGDGEGISELKDAAKL